MKIFAFIRSLCILADFENIVMILVRIMEILMMMRIICLRIIMDYLYNI